MKKYTEQEMSEVLVKWLREQKTTDKVYQEVQFRFNGKIADIVRTTLSGGMEIIECKTTLNWDVFKQAVEWKVVYSSIAILGVRSKRTFQYSILKDYGIGIYEIHMGVAPFVRMISKPYEHKQNFNTQERYKKLLLPEHESFAKAGSSVGGYYTPYAKSMVSVREYLEKHPNSSVNDIVKELGKLHYQTPQSARRSIKQALLHFEKWAGVFNEGGFLKFYVKDGKND